MTERAPSERGFAKTILILLLAAAAFVVAFLFFGATVRRFVRESLMQSVTSAHYDILCPAGALSQASMTDFAKRREPLFTALDKKLGDPASNKELRIVFDPQFPAPTASDSAEPAYSVSGTTIRTKLKGQNPQLPAAADAEALLAVAWGKPGNAQIARWCALWLAGDWHGAEIGMAAAEVEQRLGHKKVAILLGDPGGEIASPDDEKLLGAAWISEVAEFGGADTVRKLYAANMPHPNIAEVTRILGTTPLELDRKWQMWMYAYLAGMPSTPRGSGMPMDMSMPMNH
jgi:hypothetical protein